MLVPLIFAWIVFAGVILYLRYYWVMPGNFLLGLAAFFCFVYIITLTISVANIVMLEVMQQIESGERTSFGKALREALFSDLLKVVPIALAWAIVWLIIILLRVLMSRRRRSSSRAEPSIRDAARTLGGANSGPFSWTGLGLNMVEKIVRLTVFLSLPAVAWENQGPLSALRRSFEIIMTHPVHFLTAYTLTGAASVLMALPLVVVFALDDAGIHFSADFWMIVILYECVVWTANVYLEQMSVGLLYLWHLKWVGSGSIGYLSSVPKPNLLDEFYELKEGAEVVVEGT